MDEESTEQAQEGALLDLIELERRLEAELASADLEAERIVESARAEARTTSVDGDTALAEDLDALRESVERECMTTLREIEERARAEAARYQGVGEEEQQQLARWVASRLVGTDGGP